jgi:glycosyltransferase involved in cell wall biosynthesis
LRSENRASGRNKVRLLYFHPTTVFGGAERTTTTLLEKLDKSIFEVVLITKKGVFPSLPANETIYIDDLGVKDGFGGFRALMRDAKIIGGLIKKKADVAFGMLHYGCIVLSVIKFISGDRVRIVASPRTPSKAAIDFYLKDEPLKKALWNFMIKFFCRYSDYVVAASKGIREECISGYKAERKKVIVVNNSVDVQSVTELSAKPVEGETPCDALIISTAGRLAPEKNMEVLLKSFAKLRRDLNVRLWVIGDGPERRNLEYLAASLNLTDSVVFWGFQENPYKFIGRSDVFVHTSLFEGFGNIILEAMACGVPVIATDCPFGPCEIINNGETGMLVPVSDEPALTQALKLVLEDKGLRDLFIKNAYVRLIDFTPESMVRHYEDIFLNIARANVRFQPGEGREDFFEK